jgi:hypothetical protein
MTSYAAPVGGQKKLGLVIDLDTCVGCHACAVNCKEWSASGHSAPLTDFDPYGADAEGVWFNRVHSYEVADDDHGRTVHLPRSCLHCEEPACVSAEGALLALHRRHHSPLDPGDGDRPVRRRQSPGTGPAAYRAELPAARDGFAIARKHAHKLRRTALLLGFAAPLVLTLLASSAHRSPPLAGILAVSAGVLAERWLFFAQAKHTVTLYYGALEA